jgi:hypothetical protein
VGLISISALPAGSEVKRGGRDGRTGRDPPQENPAPVDPADLVGYPVTLVPDVGNDPRTRLQGRAQLRPQFQVRLRMQEQDHHCRRPHVGGIHVVKPELHFVLDTCVASVRLRPRHQRGIELDPHATRAELFGRGDRDAPVPGPEIVDDVLRADVSQLEHRAHDGRRRRLEANVPSGNRPTAEHRKQSDDERQGDLFQAECQCHRACYCAREPLAGLRRPLTRAVMRWAHRT